MDAIAGIYDPEADPESLARDLTRMRRALEPSCGGIRAESATGRGAACIVIGQCAGRRLPWVARDPRRGLWLIVVGELFGGAESRQPVSGDAAGSDAEHCLRLFERDGAALVERLNGHFTVVVYSEAERQLSIATDPFGYQPLFLATRGRRVLFASEMKAILAVRDVPPVVDGVGLLQLARHGWPLGERTWLEAIRVAAPGTWHNVSARGVREQRYFRISFRRGPTAASFSAYTDVFAGNMRRAMQRATAAEGRIGIPLSGGLDSRTLLLAAESETQRLLTYTFGRAGSRDVDYAAQLARAAGVAHLHLPYDTGYLSRWLAPIVWRTEGLLPFSEVTFTSMHFHAALAAHVDVILYGHAGDALTGAHLPQALPLWRSRERVIQRVFRQCNRVPERLLRRVFRPSFYRRFAPELLDSLRATFADIDQEELADVLSVWDMENRQRRGTFASAAADRYRFRVRAPFLDRDVVAHLCQAPPRWRLQQLAYKRMILTQFPYAAPIRWAYTGQRLQASWCADFGTLARAYLERRLRRAVRLSPTRLPDDFRDLCADTRGDRQLAHVIRQFAANPSFPGEIFDRRGIEEAVSRHWDGGEDLTHLVSMLATFAAAYRLLLWQEPMAMEAAPAA